MSRALSVLLVEDCEDDALLTLVCLRDAGFDPRWQRVDNDVAMAAALDEKDWDLVISDHNMPNFSAPEALTLLRDRGSDVPFIIVSGSIGEAAAVRAMKAGAQDYIVKGQLARLPAAIERELADVEERRARRVAEQRIHFLAYYDPLTSLPNRLRCCEELTGLLNDPERNSLTLAVLNTKLDNLNQVINTLGHHTGERVLLEVARRLEQLPPTYPRARIATDEFAIILPNGDIDSASRIAREIQQLFVEPIIVDAMEVQAVVTIGIALYPGHAEEAEALLQRSNAALAQATETPLRLAIYDRGRDPYQPERLSMISELRRGIESNQLRLQYQPKVRFGSGELVGVEALVRWQHPKLGLLSPDRFIPLAERTGLINPLTRWVLKESMRQSFAWHRTGLDISIAINLSANNLHSIELADSLGQLLSASGVRPERLVLEVTESAIMTDESRAVEILRKLHDQGVEIAIDDFGTGYSSFANLRRLPVSEIKIDKSFVIGMNANSEDQIIVDSIIALGHRLSMQVVAEGVETLPTWHALENLRCDLAQGYYLSRPLSPDDFVHWTRAFVPPTSNPPAASRYTA